MNFKREDLEALRLLKAFARITDPDKRRELVAWAEKSARPKPDEHPPR